MIVMRLKRDEVQNNRIAAEEPYARKCDRCNRADTPNEQLGISIFTVVSTNAFVPALCLCCYHHKDQGPPK